MEKSSNKCQYKTFQFENAYKCDGLGEILINGLSYCKDHAEEIPSRTFGEFYGGPFTELFDAVYGSISEDFEAKKILHQRKKVIEEMFASIIKAYDDYESLISMKAERLRETTQRSYLIKYYKKKENNRLTDDAIQNLLVQLILTHKADSAENTLKSEQEAFDRHRKAVESWNPAALFR
jgi:hypothetical protein